MEAVIGGIVALWIISRSNFSSSKTLTFEVNNPFDQKTAGYVSPNGVIVQPTYGKVKQPFPLPKIKYCKRIGKTANGHRTYYVYYVEDSPSRVDLVIPKGNIGAGQAWNRSNMVSPNMGAGYYVIMLESKTWNGSDYPTSYPSSYKWIGLPNRKYLTAQRFMVHQTKEAAIAQGEQVLTAYDAETQPDPNPDPDPTPDQPELPPLDPQPELPPLDPQQPPTSPPDLPPSKPDPPVDPDGGNGGGGYQPPIGGGGGLAPIGVSTISSPQPTIKTPIPPSFSAVNNSNEVALSNNGKNALMKY